MVRTATRKETVFFAMGTVCRIAVYSDSDAPAVRLATRRVHELNDRLNAYDPRSEIAAINRSAGEAYTPVSEDTLKLIRNAKEYARLSDGMFDITTTPLSLLWKDAIKTKLLPLFYEIAAAKALVDYRDILISDNAVMLKRAGQKLDLGAIAKGFAADEVRRILTENGVETAVVNLGGTVTVIGNARRVGIQHPFRQTGVACASIDVKNKTVVTSGIYEQGFSLNGSVYHHIVNPKTGYPSQSDLASVTLIGENGETLDALCTAALIMTAQNAVRFLRRFDVEAILIKRDGSIYVTEALQNKFVITEGAEP